MAIIKSVNEKHTKWIRWTARIWSIILIAYALLLFIGYGWNLITTGKADPNAMENYPFIENLPPLFMFAAILGLGLGFAWKWEKIGGIINLSFCLATLPILFIHWPIPQDSRYIMPYLLLLIVAIPGILFLISHKRSKMKSKNDE